MPSYFHPLNGTGVICQRGNTFTHSLGVLTPGPHSGSTVNSRFTPSHLLPIAFLLLSSVSKAFKITLENCLWQGIM